MENKIDLGKKANIGLSIVVTRNLGNGGFIKATNSEGKEVVVSNAVLECIREHHTIEVMAFGTQNAIERILYRVGGLLPHHRQFFLTQIIFSLVSVKNEWDDVEYGPDSTIIELIREDKMYRIITRENELKEEKI